MDIKKTVVFLGLVLAIAVSFYFYVQSNKRSTGPQTGSPETTKTDSKPEHLGAKMRNAELKIIEQFFNDQKAGRDSKALFCYDFSVVTFFAVRNYEIVDGKEGFSRYTIRVDSSNKGGQPITKLWKVVMLTEIDASKSCISSIEEAQ